MEKLTETSTGNVNEWSKNSVKLLIKEYEARPELWDPGKPLYKDIAHKERTIAEIAAQFDVSAKEVKKKFLYLRCQYNGEKRKLNSERKNSRWEFFDSLKFLNVKNSPILTRSANLRVGFYYKRKTVKASETMIKLALKEIRKGQSIQRMAIKYGVGSNLLQKRKQRALQLNKQESTDDDVSQNESDEDSVTQNDSDEDNVSQNDSDDDVSVSRTAVPPNRTTSNAQEEVAALSSMDTSLTTKPTDADEHQIFGDYVAEKMRGMKASKCKRLKYVIQKTIIGLEQELLPLMCVKNEEEQQD